MIRWIVKKEFINNIQSFRFFTLFAIAITLFGINAFISSKEFHQELLDYSKSVVNHSVYDTRAISVDKRPNPLVFVTDGQSKNQDKSLNITRTGDITPAGVVYRGNYLLQNYEVIDWAFIIKLLFSIFAILFTYDAVCGEKEQKTLALVCSNGIQRGSIIFGKYLGAITTLAVPFFAGVLVNIIIISLMGKIDLNAQMVARIGFIVIIGLICLSVFVLIGLLISSATHRTPTSLLLGLGVWLVFVIVIPTLAGMAGEHFTKVPTESEFLERQESLYQIYWDKNYGQKLLQDIVRNKSLTDVKEIQGEAEKLLSRAEDERIKLNQDMWHAVESKENSARNRARISPSAEFQFLAESLAFTGIASERSFYKSAQNFIPVYRNYIQDKTGVAYNFNVQPYPWQIEAGGKMLSISASRQPQFPKRLKSFPQFSELYSSISESFKYSVLDIALLLLWNLLILLLSISLFVKYDVR